MPEITDKMTAEEQVFFKDICSGKADFEDMDRDLHDKIYEWYLPEMPYGVAKARTGDPDAWIYDRLSEEYFV